MPTERAQKERTKAVDIAVSQIEKQFGKGSIMRYGDTTPPAIEAISTGSLGIDLALGIGGVPRGRVVEIFGSEASGKTTLARLVATVTQAAFEPVSAVTSGVADLRRIVAEARERQGMHQQATILFVDEIHRFNKAQQDVILPHVENGTITFIGATTENPSFEVIAPLLPI